MRWGVGVDVPCPRASSASQRGPRPETNFVVILSYRTLLFYTLESSVFHVTFVWARPRFVATASPAPTRFFRLWRWPLGAEAAPLLGAFVGGGPCPPMSFCRTAFNYSRTIEWRVLWFIMYVDRESMNLRWSWRQSSSDMARLPSQ